MIGANQETAGAGSTQPVATRESIRTAAGADSLSYRLWLAAVIVVARLIASRGLHLFDDAFITFRYARNLASGLGLVYQPGEWVLGTTAPAFAILLAPLEWLGAPIGPSVVTLNIACDIATWWLCLAAVDVQRRRLFAAALAFFVAASPILMRVGVGGMEANAFVLVAVAALRLHTRGRPKLAVALASAAYFLRPEAALLVAVLCAAQWQRSPLAALRSGALALAVVAPGLILIVLTYGTPLPQSVIAKSHDTGTSLLEVTRLLLLPDPVSGLLMLFGLAGMVHALRSGGFARLLVAWACLHVLAYMVARPRVWFWYGQPAYLCAAFGAALTVVTLLDSQRIRRLRPHLERFAPVIAALALLSPLAIVLKFRDQSVATNVYEPMRQFASENISPSNTILAFDIGAIGYYSNARIYDAAGLVWPPALTQDARAIVKTYRPDYILLTARESLVQMVNEPGFDAYRSVARFSARGEHGLELDPSQYPKHWVQDYLLLKRVRPQ